jgi:hypothetical protein
VGHEGRKATSMESLYDVARTSLSIALDPESESTVPVTDRAGPKPVATCSMVLLHLQAMFSVYVFR